jgi:hypothetical protein
MKAQEKAQAMLSDDKVRKERKHMRGLIKKSKL